jgi:hypothetical protein
MSVFAPAAGPILAPPNSARSQERAIVWRDSELIGDIAWPDNPSEVVGALNELGIDIAQSLGQQIGNAELEATKEVAVLERLPG